MSRRPKLIAAGRVYYFIRYSLTSRPELCTCQICIQHILQSNASRKSLSAVMSLPCGHELLVLGLCGPLAIKTRWSPRHAYACMMSVHSCWFALKALPGMGTSCAEAFLLRSGGS